MPPKTVTSEDLRPGFEFPQTSYTLEPKVVAAYLKAVGETDEAESGRGAAVPPMAVAALAIRGLIEQLNLQPGSVQLSQEVEFFKPVLVGETVASRAGVSRKQERAGLKLVTFDINVFDRAGDKVVASRMLVSLPGERS